MISIINVHGCVSVSVSMTNLVDTVRKYVIASMTGSEGANCKNTSGFFGFFTEISFQKRNSLNYQRHVFTSNANNLFHG